MTTQHHKDGVDEWPVVQLGRHAGSVQVWTDSDGPATGNSYERYYPASAPNVLSRVEATELAYLRRDLLDTETPEVVYMEQFGVRYLCVPVQSLPPSMAALMLAAAFPKSQVTAEEAR